MAYELYFILYFTKKKSFLEDDKFVRANSIETSQLFVHFTIDNCSSNEKSLCVRSSQVIYGTNFTRTQQ